MMNYEIERDEKGEPLRMYWTPGPGLVSSEDIERARCAYENSLPMPSMREWARERGL